MLTFSMEATAAPRFCCPSLHYPKRFGGSQGGFLRFSRRLCEEEKLQLHIVAPGRQRSASLEVSCSYKNFPASLVESESFQAPFDEVIELKNKAKEIEPYLSGRSVYLVGMMGSGKTTIGKVLSEVLGYSFVDSDTLIEQAMDGTSVAQIFQLYGEEIFREKESEVLQKLSLNQQLVVSTGGGVVIRPINWKSMHNGVSVWLDVPLEALAQRIAKVGTNSRPLLHQESGDPYTKAFKRLSMLWKERGQAYTNADARVSLENIAAKQGHRDVSFLTPAVIAIEALEQIKYFLKEEGNMSLGGL